MSQDSHDGGGRAVGFTGLVDLAAAALGGRALGANDEFFAGADNLIQPGRGQFIDGKFTDRGKWMDGWESRRKRGPGHDWCILALGAPGEVVGLDIDTHHFRGNHPPFASVDGLLAPPGADVDAGGVAALERLPWVELLEQSPLLPDSQNLFGARPRGPVSHVRLNIFPDGGVARLRVFGRVEPRWDAAERDAETAAEVPAGLDDLCAVKNGGLALACSDAFFGPMNNLLHPGRGANMGDGWETRRRRGPGHDWILIRLGARGRPQVIEVDTHHFKGNFPDRCALEALDADAAPSARITDLLASPGWVPVLPETRLAADTRHFFRALAPASTHAPAPATHVRLSIFPDGGVSRLRVWGSRGG
jgi:allantoicase